MTVIDNPSLGGDSVPALTSGPDPETGNERAAGPERKVRRRRFRFTRRRRRRAVADRWVARAQRRRWWRLASVVLVVALIGGAVWAAWFSSLLAVHQVSVIGLSDEGELVGGQGSVGGIYPGRHADRAPGYRLGPGSRSRAAVGGIGRGSARMATRCRDLCDRTFSGGRGHARRGRRGVDAEGNIFDRSPGGLWLTDPIIRGDKVPLPRQ